MNRFAETLKLKRLALAPRAPLPEAAALTFDSLAVFSGVAFTA
jgi:hypothetical protein